MPKTGSHRSQSSGSQESYSAVIIADLVAEVQQEPKSDKKVKSKVIEETNVDEIDGKAPDNSARHIPTEGKATATNGTNISKGVILNAAQFVQPDNRIEVIDPIEETEEAEEGEEEKDKDAPIKLSDMTPLRKIAFGLSFVPPLMFVLCFSVIFPCIKVLPCSNEVWSITLNDTEVTSRLKIAQNVLFSFLTDENAGLQSLDKASGETVWTTFTTFPTLYTECGKLASSDSPSCLIMDDNGTLSLFDQLNGKKLWQLNSYEDKIPSFPVILPDCDNDGVDEIAQAVSSSKMKLIFLGSESLIDVPDCESIPFNLLKWQKKNGTDLVLSCKKGQEDILLRIPQNKWCKNDNEASEKTSVLFSTKAGVLSKSKLLPSVNGLTIWSEDTVTMFNNDASVKWTVTDSNHTKKNRFLFHAKVNKDEPRIILYSSDIGKNFQITMIDFEKGVVTLSKAIPNTEILDAILILGKKYDFVLSHRKKFAKSFKSEEEEQNSEISAKLRHLLTKENSILSLNSTSKLVDELILMHLDGRDIQTLQTFNFFEGEVYSTLCSAILKENEDLDIYILRKAQDEEYTTVKRISISNWDASSALCTWQ